MSRVYVTIFFSLLSIFCSAQIDKVHLSNHGYLRGQVISGDNISLVFVVNQMDTININWSNVVTVYVQDKSRLQSSLILKVDSVNRLSNNKLHLAFDFGGQFDNSDGTNKFRASPGILTYFRWKQYLQLGIGVGYYQFSTFHALPIFFQYQGDFSHNPSKGLFYYLAIGESHAWGKSSNGWSYDDVEGGRFLKLGVGYKWKIEMVNMSITAGWLQQRMHANIDNGPEFLSIVGGGNRTAIKQSLNGFEIKLGVIF